MRNFFVLTFVGLLTAVTGYGLFFTSSDSNLIVRLTSKVSSSTVLLPSIALPGTAIAPLKRLPYLTQPLTGIKPVSSASANLKTYLEITEGCSLVIDKTCAHAYATTSTSTKVRATLRVGSVFFVDQTVTAPDGSLWYSVAFEESLRYPERLLLPWFVPALYGEIHTEIGPEYITPSTTPSSKRIVVVKNEQMLYAYDGDTLFLQTPVSTGLLATPTPRGTFTIYKKTPTRYMQGPITGLTSQYYDLPGVPWNLYFTEQGAVVHGAFWHDSFGQPWSHGCVNVAPDEAKKLYVWADIGMPIIIK